MGLLILAVFTYCVPMAMPMQHVVAYCGDLGLASQYDAAMLSVLLGSAFLARQGGELANSRHDVRRPDRHGGRRLGRRPALRFLRRLLSRLRYRHRLRHRQSRGGAIPRAAAERGRWTIAAAAPSV
jgi:hypothetical protein